MEKIDWDEGTLASRRLGGRGNLVTTWKTWARFEYGSLTKAYEAIAADLGGGATITNISRWERGVRRLPPLVANYMMHDVLPVVLKESSDPAFIEERIRLPEEPRHE